MKAPASPLAAGPRLAALALGLLLAACASVQEPPPTPVGSPVPSEPPLQGPPTVAPEGPAAPTLPEPLEIPTPPATPQAERKLPAAVLWAHGAEYRAATIQIFRAAGEELEELAEVLEPGAWAVVLDVDETVLSNLPHEVERARAGRGFEREHWHAWIERRAAKPLPGAIGFVERVRELGGVVALITNRDQAHCPATEDNLRRQRVPYDVILCRPDGGPGDKGPRWTALREGTAAAGLPPLEIVMAVGDNIRDFPPLDQSLRNAPEKAFAEFGETYFVIPNPLYGSFEEIPVE